MKTLRKYLSVFLCLCMSAYAVPSFAFTTSSESDFYKAQLSDVDLDKAIGGGHVDATLADYTVAGSEVTAVFANRSIIGLQYTLSVVNSNGVIQETLASGNMEPSTAILVSGVPTVEYSQVVKAELKSGGGLKLISTDTSWALE